MDLLNDRYSNLIGIVLNFVSGCLLSPEIVGRDRINRLEHRLELIAWSLVALGRAERRTTVAEPPSYGEVSKIYGFVVLINVAYWVFIRSQLTAGLNMIVLVAASVIVIRAASRMDWLTRTASLLRMGGRRAGKFRRSLEVFHVFRLESALVALIYVVMLYGLGLGHWLVMVAVVYLWSTSAVVSGIANGVLGQGVPQSVTAGSVAIAVILMFPYLVVSGMLIFVFTFAAPLLLVVIHLSRLALNLLDPAQGRLHGWLKRIGIASFFVGNLLLLVAWF